MSTSSLPTIVLVHGACHTPPIYQPFITSLQSAGFTVHCPLLPSCTGSSPPSASLLEDVACVRSLVTNLISSSSARILMIMHSYGGCVGTDAVEGLFLSSRSAAGLPGGVVHLLYLCAYILPPGGSVWGVVEEAGFAPLWDQYIENFPDGTCALRDPRAAFYNGVEDSEVETAVGALVPFPLAAFKARTSGDEWRRVPVTYVRATEDRAVPAGYSEIMLRRVKGEGVHVRVVEVETGHSPFLSRRGEMVGLAVEAAGDERNEG